MITERRFASSYSSFWRFALPLSDSYVRHLNARLATYLPPYQVSATPDRIALVSEVGFRYFADLTGGKRKLDLDSVDPADFQRVALQAWSYIRSLSNSLEELPPPSEQDHKDALALANRIKAFFFSYESGQRILPRPQFSGCGLVSSCEGDVLAGNVLYEIKNVERDFRSVDLRQLLTYCALNYASESHIIDAIGLLNARTGKFFRISLGALCRGIAGTSDLEVLSEIVRFLAADHSYA